MEDIIRINPKDNVVVALKNLKKDTVVDLDNTKIKLKNNIENGHKIAVKPILVEENIIKYGFVIGKAVCDIEPGEFVHYHNMKTNLEKIEQYTYPPKSTILNCKKKDLFFKGFKRVGCKVGIRNELWIIPSVSFGPSMP